MSHISIRFNKSRGQPGRGTPDHVWRVFVDGQEYLFKHFKINVPSVSEMDASGQDWNISCDGVFQIDYETSTAIVDQAEGQPCLA
jgi:hypothetical protein